MGTSVRTAIHRLDYDRLCTVTAPALRRLLAASAPQELPPWLDTIVESAFRDAASNGVQRVRAGLSLTLIGSCERLGSDLGLRDDDRWLLGATASDSGACASRSCPQASRCPLHPTGQGEVGASNLCRMVAAAFATCCAGASELGVLSPWPAFLEWRALERDPHDPSWLDWNLARLLEELEADPLLALLLRLSRRGVLLVTANEEGVVGWLTPRETLVLNAALERALNHTRVPDSLARYSAYAAETELPEVRKLMHQVHSIVQAAATRQQGAALSRQR
ncbi:MAG: hypothetical protein ACOY0T_16485 [Myxococcota bacterium]